MSASDVKGSGQTHLPIRALKPAERAELVTRIRFELGLRRGRKVSQAEFARLVSEIIGLDKPLSDVTVHGWEKGAEPGFLAGCAIAHLGGLPAEALAFRSESSAPAKASGFPKLKGRPIVPAPAKRRGKSA
jgi:hypothetical protein